MQIRGQAARRAAVDDEGLGLGQPAREEGVEHGVEDAMAAEEQLLPLRPLHLPVHQAAKGAPGCDLATAPAPACPCVVYCLVRV